MEWDTAILSVTGLVVLLRGAFGKEYWQLVENVKATGRVGDGYAGILGMALAIPFFGVLGFALTSFIERGDPMAGLTIGGLVGLLISLRASEIHTEGKE